MIVNPSTATTITTTTTTTTAAAAILVVLVQRCLGNRAFDSREGDFSKCAFELKVFYYICLIYRFFILAIKCYHHYHMYIIVVLIL